MKADDDDDEILASLHQKSDDGGRGWDDDDRVWSSLLRVQLYLIDSRCFRCCVCLFNEGDTTKRYFKEINILL